MSRRGISKSKQLLMSMDGLEIYKLVLSGSLNRLPAGFWMQPEALQNAEKIMNWLFKEELKWTEEDVMKKFNMKTLSKHKLAGIFSCEGIRGLHDLIILVYPNIKPWQMNITSDKFWKNRDNVKTFMNWLFKEELQWSEEDVREKFNTSTVYDKFPGYNSYGYTLYDLARMVYDDIRPWLLKGAILYRGFWCDESNVKWFMNWLFREELKWTEEDVKEKFDSYILPKYGFVNAYNIPMSDLIWMVYPNIKPWEMKVAPNGFWKDPKNISDAVTWLFVEKLGCNNYQEAYNSFNRFKFMEYGLSTIYKTHTKGNLLKMINFDTVN